MTTLIANGLDGLTQMVLGVLAVGGAFLLGYVSVMLLLSVGLRIVTKKLVPLRLNKLLRIVGGLALAAIVAMFVFGDGGMGYGAGAGGLPGSGKGAPDRKRTASPTAAELQPPVRETVPPDSDLKPERRVRVTVLGGAIQSGRFYQFETQPGGLTLDELKTLVADRRDKPGSPLTQIEIMVYRDSPDVGGKVVRDLQTWSNSQGLRVVYPPVGEQLRPE